MGGRRSDWRRFHYCNAETGGGWWRAEVRDLFKNQKGRREPAVGAGGAESRGARCALQPLPGSGLLWGLRGGRGRGALRGAGAEAAELRSGRADCPRSGLWGKSPPARGRPARPPAGAAPLSESGDVTALCRVPTLSPRSPPSAPGAQPSLRDRGGSPGKRKEPGSGRLRPRTLIAGLWVR